LFNGENKEIKLNKKKKYKNNNKKKKQRNIKKESKRNSKLSKTPTKVLNFCFQVPLSSLCLSLRDLWNPRPPNPSMKL
jgi:hypothetical protein